MFYDQQNGICNPQCCQGGHNHPEPNGGIRQTFFVKIDDWVVHTVKGKAEFAEEGEEFSVYSTGPAFPGQGDGGGEKEHQNTENIQICFGKGGYCAKSYGNTQEKQLQNSQQGFLGGREISFG